MRVLRSVFLGMLVIVMVTVFPFLSEAAVNVNIQVFPPPPVFRIPAPPPVFVIPGTYVYAVPNIDVEILFHQGHWYRPYEGRWYRSSSYNGPWVYIDSPKVPCVLFNLPPDYHRIPPGHQKIPYGQLKKYWGKWERERYWEHDEGWNRGHTRRDGFGPDNRHDGPPRHDQDFGRGGKGHQGKGHK